MARMDKSGDATFIADFSPAKTSSRIGRLNIESPRADGMIIIPLSFKEEFRVLRSRSEFPDPTAAVSIGTKASAIGVTNEAGILNIETARVE